MKPFSILDFKSSHCALAIFFGVLSAFFHLDVASAAACCGGGFAAPSLIVGDDQAQITTSYAYSQMLADVSADSIWYPRDSKETSESFKIEAARVFLDQWQVGVSVPLLRRARAGDSSSGLGDVSTSVGYEYLPDWDYSVWRPRGLGYLQLTLPTGRSVHESESAFQLDSRGRGFWAIGAGTILAKIIHKWDSFASLDVHRSFDKVDNNSQGELTLMPGYGGDFGIGGGYNLTSLRLGASLTWSYEDPIEVAGVVNSRSAPQRLATASLSLSYLLATQWATTVSYNDQSLFGDPSNTTLSRGVSVFLQRRWQR